jgi:hypothetical protein
MMKKFWDRFSSWESAKQAWDLQAEEAAKQTPLKILPVLPKMPGITPDTARGLKWKSIRYIFKHDENRVIGRYILRHPFRYAFSFLRSLLRGQSYVRDGDFFLYGLSDMASFEKHLTKPETLFIVGFSYCHKPHECPSGRFTDACQHDTTNPVCRQCFIGKAVHALPERDVVLLFIPTIHYIGEKIFEVMEQYPGRQITFLITACEMTLEMFGDFGNMVGIRGLGVRLDGRICNTMQAFILSERGVKPGLTVVLEPTQQKILDLIRLFRYRSCSSDSDTNGQKA